MKAILLTITLLMGLSTSCSKKGNDSGGIIAPPNGTTTGATTAGTSAGALEEDEGTTSSGVSGGTTDAGTDGTVTGETAGGTTDGTTTSGTDGTTTSGTTTIGTDGTTTDGTTTSGTTTSGTDGTTTGTTTSGTDGTTTPPPEPPAVTIQSTMVDAPIAGLKYVSTTYSGHTSSSGTFPCNSGNGTTIVPETIQFFLSDQNDSNTNDIFLGQTTCRKVMSPMAFYGSTTITTSVSSLSSSNQIRLKRVLRILQSLDIDSNPENGISFDSVEISDLANYLDNTHVLSGAIAAITHHSKIDASEFTTEINGLMSAIGRAGQVKTETVAVNHFNTWKAYCTDTGCNFPYTCLRGNLFSDPTQANFNIIDPATGLNRGAFSEFPTDALVVLRYNNLSEVYRLEEGGIYADVDLWDQTFKKFKGTWAHSATPGVGLRIRDIQFENATDTLAFSQATSLSGTINMDELHYKFGSLSTDRNWTVSNNCTVPTNVNNYPE